MFAMFESTSGYSTRYFVCTDVSNSGISYYSDSNVPDPYNLDSYNLDSYTGSKVVRSKRNNIQLDITPGAAGPVALTTEPATLDLGARPNGAWMAPYKFQIQSSGTTNVTALDLSGSYFTYNAELPATINAQNPLEVEITTGDAEPGIVNSTLTVLYSDNRDAAQFDVTPGIVTVPSMNYIAVRGCGDPNQDPIPPVVHAETYDIIPCLARTTSKQYITILAR